MIGYKLFLCFFLFLLALPVSATPVQQQFEELKAQYLSLRNTDLGLTRADEWMSLAKKFERLADKNPKFEENPSALLNAAILLQVLYKQFGGADRIEKAAVFYERIARDYPGHHLVDDALLNRGDLLLFELKRESVARRAFQELVRAYPESELVPVARLRLESIQTGAYLLDTQGEGSEVSKSSTGQSGERVPLIVIDPGHGGEDFGAQGIAGLLEKDVVLAISFELERLLKEKMNAVVRFTRRGDVFVPLAARTQLANDFDADLFVSVHANASPKGKASGFEVYYLDNSDNSASQKLAERENASMQFEGAEGDLQFMLSDLIQNAKLDDSIILANGLHRAMAEYLPDRWNGVRGLGVKKAPFFVLVGAHMPCVLVETFFINNPLDGARLAQKEFRADVAHAIFLGIKDYYEQHIQ